MLLTHIALHVPNADVCAHWYTDFCGMKETLRHGESSKPVIWMADPRQMGEFVLVLLSGGPSEPAIASGFSHLGFAVDSIDAVDQIAEKAERKECLLWPPRQDPWPANYYCGVLDPAGNQIEFSYGQPSGEDLPGKTV